MTSILAVLLNVIDHIIDCRDGNDLKFWEMFWCSLACFTPIINIIVVQHLSMYFLNRYFNINEICQQEVNRLCRIGKNV